MTDVMEKDVRYLRLLNLFAFIAMVAMNLVAELVPLNGVTSGQVSDMYASLFTPAGITFSIWGVIYLALAYFAFWQAFLAKKEDIEVLNHNKTIFIVRSPDNIKKEACMFLKGILPKDFSYEDVMKNKLKEL